MKHLDLETCKYLVSLRCVSESGKLWILYPKGSEHAGQTHLIDNGQHGEESRRVFNITPAFSLEDLLRPENAKKIWPQPISQYTHKPEEENWSQQTRNILYIFQFYPDTWPEEVKKLILPKGPNEN